jgi:ubiquitin-protein ligase
MAWLVLSLLYFSLVVVVASEGARKTPGSCNGLGSAFYTPRVNGTESFKEWRKPHGDDLLIRRGNIQTGGRCSIADIATFIASYGPLPTALWDSSVHNTTSMTWSNTDSNRPTGTSSRRKNELNLHTSRRRSRPSRGRTSTPKTTMLRIQREWKDMIQSGVAFDWYTGVPVQRKNISSHVWIGPLTFRQWDIWHFTFTGINTRGSEGTSSSIHDDAVNPYSNGVYHGRLILPKTYPMKPPRIQLLTPNGRYAVGQDICLSVSNYHPETWQLSMWNIFSIVESLRYHMMTSNIQNEVGTIQPPMSFEQKQLYANQSRRCKLSIRISSSDGRNERNIVRVDHHRMIREGWISDFRRPLVDEANTSVPILRSKLHDDAMIDHTIASRSTLHAAAKRRRKQRTSVIAAFHRKISTRKIKRRNKNISLSEALYVNGCKLVFAYPWVTVGLLGMLFLILNVEYRHL